VTRRYTRRELVQYRGVSSYRVSTLRQRLKLTPLQFARLLGVDRRTVYRWEAGDSAPMATTVTVLRVLEQHATVESAHAIVHAGGLRELVYRALKGSHGEGREGRRDHRRAAR
jgi:DNA-binding transcriptional regulator YiaG